MNRSLVLTEASILIEPLEWTKREGKIGDMYHPYLVDGKPHIGVGHLIQPGENFVNGLSYREVKELFEIDLGIRYDELVKSGKIFEGMNVRNAAGMLSWYFNTGSLTAEFYNRYKEYLFDKDLQRFKDYFFRYWIMGGSIDLTPRRKKELEYLTAHGSDSIIDGNNGGVYGILAILVGLYFIFRS